jgi:cytochrome c oxidase subunit 3
MSDHDHDHPDYLAHHFDTPDQQFEAGKLGMWLFLVTEVLMFGGLFCAYALYRANHPDIFAYAHGFLDWKLGAVNTAILLASSFTMALAVRASQLGQQGVLVGMLVLTLGGGFGFLGIKYVEYTSKFGHSIWPGQMNLYYPIADIKLYQEDADGNRITDDQGNPIPITREMQLREIAFVEFETLAIKHHYTPLGADAEQYYLDMGVRERLEEHGHAEHFDHVFHHGGHGTHHADDADHGSPDGHADHGGDDGHGHAGHGDAHAAADDPAYDYGHELALVPVAGEAPARSKVPAPAYASTGLSPSFAHDADEAETPGLAETLGAPDLSHAKHYIPYAMQPEGVQRRIHLFFQIYYCATGLHALHVLIGMGCITWVLGKSLAGAFTAEYNVPVDIVGLYWHIVDLIWIFLFPLLYLIH